MEILIFSFNATAPVILCMALGLFLQRIGLFDQPFSRRLSNICFQVFMPVMLLFNIYNIDFGEQFLYELVIFAVVAQACLITLLCLIFFPAFKQDKAKAAAYIHLCYRSNYVMFGVALSQNMFGTPGLRIASMLIPVSLIMFNITAVMLFSYCSVTEKVSGRQLFLQVVRNIVKNPLIVTSALALPFSLSPLSMPAFLYTTAGNLAGVTVPLCLVVIGSQIDLSSLKNNAKIVSIMSCARLVIVPMVMLPIAVYMGFRGAALAALFVLFASPCANAGAIMAQKYNVYPDLANQVLAATTVFGGLTSFAWIILLRYFELF